MSAELYKLTTFGLLILLIALCYDGYKKYRAKPIGTSVQFEKNTGLQDFTICPWFYNKNLQIADITSDSGHRVEDVMKTLPSIKSLILSIMVGDFRNSSKEATFFNILDQSTWVESIRRNELDPNNLLRCATIEWPNDFQLQTNNYVMMHLNSSVVKLMFIQFHDRGNAEILTNFANNNFLSLMFPIVGRWYDLNMKTSKRISNCNSQKIFDCTMEFIVSQMNCSMEWEAQYYPANFPTCQSKEDLKKYIELRKSVYNGEFEKEIRHCFGKKCQQNYTMIDLRLDMDMEYVDQYILPSNKNDITVNDITYDSNISVLTFSKKNEMVEVSEEYYAYDFTSFLADVGGNIGLLLGWSILSIIECFGEGLKEYMNKLWKRRHEN